jgi:hypothetical protein
METRAIGNRSDFIYRLLALNDFLNLRIKKSVNQQVVANVNLADPKQKP